MSNKFIDLVGVVGSSALMAVAACAMAGAEAAEATMAVEGQEEVASLTLTITTDGSGGAVMLAMFDSEDGFQNDKPIKGLRVDVTGPSQSLSVEGLKAGPFAIKAYHDQNGDGELNSNPFGIPTEPFAFSNGAKPRFGPPTWGDAKFTLDAGENTHSLDFKGGR
ncbi:MAG: DUF2141 domain-containing protein [Pseudomonadota bacterium]